MGATCCPTRFSVAFAAAGRPDRPPGYLLSPGTHARPRLRSSGRKTPGTYVHCPLAGTRSSNRLRKRPASTLPATSTLPASALIQSTGLPIDPAPAA
jgi:hypothetical protein